MKKIISLLLVIVALVAFSSCGKETDVPDGMQLLTKNEDYTVFVPENWIIDDANLSYAHAPSYAANDTRAFYASVQITKYNLKTGESVDLFVENYINSLKNEFENNFENKAPISYDKNGENIGKSLEYSINKANGKELYKSTFIVKDDKIIEVKYIANEIESLYESNLEDYNKILEHIEVK